MTLGPANSADHVDRFLSWVCLALAVAALAAIAWYVPFDRTRMRPLFDDFEVELPAITAVVYAIPAWAFPAVAILIGLLLLFAQWSWQGRALATILHLLVLAGCLLAFELYREAKLAVLFKLLQSLS